MKRCPKCDRTYTDETLNFCLEDGEWLLDVQSGDESGTAVLEPGISPSEAQTLPQVRTTDRTAILPGRIAYEGRRGGTSINRKILLAAGMIVVLLGAGVLGYRYFRRSPVEQIDSLAVLPFINASGDSEIEYLSDGMTEALINSLSQLPNLSVKARSSVFRYKGREIEPTAAGTELNVQAVLNGRMVQRGDQLTLSLELVEAATGNQIWGDQYSRKLGDLAALQNEITRDVSEKLRQRLTGEQARNITRNQTPDTEAFQLYLQGRYYWNKRTIDANRKAIDYFQQAIVKDPSFAMAYVGLAECYVTGFLSHHERKPKVEAAAQRAIEIEPTLGEPHAVLGMMRTSDFDYTAAESEFIRAIELSPNYATAYHWYAESLAMQGRFDESFAQYNKALELDPLSLAISTDLGRTYYLARQNDRAIEHLTKLIEMDPNYARTHFYLATAYQEKGMFEESIQEMEKGLVLSGEDPDTIGKGKRAVLDAYKESGPRGYWKMILEIQKVGLRNDVLIQPANIAVVNARLGQRAEAFSWIEKMFAHGGGAYAALKVSPEWDNLRGDPRFRDVLRHAGFSE